MSQVKQLEQQRKEAVELIDRRDAALRLAENRDFRKLFIEEYFTTEAARLVQLSTDPAMSPQNQADALEMAKATGHTKRYLSMIIQMASVAEREFEELDEQILEARNEEELEEREALAAKTYASDSTADVGSVQ